MNYTLLRTQALDRMCIHGLWLRSTREITVGYIACVSTWLGILFSISEMILRSTSCDKRWWQHIDTYCMFCPFIVLGRQWAFSPNVHPMLNLVSGPGS